MWRAKTRGLTIHQVFQVYQDIIDPWLMQISKLERKRIVRRTDSL